MKNSLRISSITLLSVLVLGMIVPGTTAFASEYNSGNQTSLWDIENETNPSYDKNNKQSSNPLNNDEINFLKSLGLTDSDINEVNSQGPSDVDLINGYVVNGNSDRQVRGKWSAAAKILLKNYNKLPGWIKAVVGYGAANSLAKTLETFSGTLEDGLTVGLEALGFSGGVARKFAQGIAWALF